jgi:hypothetical protein
MNHRFERKYFYTTWGLPPGNSLETLDPMQTTHRFEGIFKAVLTSMHVLI